MEPNFPGPGPSFTLTSAYQEEDKKIPVHQIVMDNIRNLLDQSRLLEAAIPEDESCIREIAASQNMDFTTTRDNLNIGKEFTRTAIRFLDSVVNAKENPSLSFAELTEGMDASSSSSSSNVEAAATVSLRTLITAEEQMLRDLLNPPPPTPSLLQENDVVDWSSGEATLQALQLSGSASGEVRNMSGPNMTGSYTYQQPPPPYTNVNVSNYPTPNYGGYGQLGQPHHMVRPPPPRQRYCPFCESHGYPPSVFTSHDIRDETTMNVICPLLRSFVCKICGTSGAVAHNTTCPYNPINNGRHQQ